MTLPDPDHALIGATLSGRYRVSRHLGAGGFGSVYAATNLALQTEVAIKVARGPMDGAYVLREATAAARLTSPHTVRVFDIGQLPSGTPFIVMELLRGRTLKEYLAQEGVLPLELAVTWLRQVCLALREAHALGIAHRDIKPSNLFVVEGRNVATYVKLLDFGLAKQVSGEQRSDLTESGMVVGSPCYMAPEQVRGAEVTTGCDVWSLGVVLYEMLSLRLPFEAPTSSGTLVAIAADPPTPLSDVRPGTPPQVTAVVEKCLRKAPSERFQSVGALAQALEELARGGGATAAVASPLHAAAEGSRSTLRSVALRGSRNRSGHLVATLVLAGAITTAVLVGGRVYHLTRVDSARALDAPPAAPTLPPIALVPGMAASETVVIAAPSAGPTARPARPKPRPAPPPPSPSAAASRLIVEPDF